MLSDNFDSFQSHHAVEVFFICSEKFNKEILMKSVRMGVILFAFGVGVAVEPVIAAELFQTSEVAANNISSDSGKKGSIKLNAAQQAELDQALGSYPRQNYQGPYFGATPYWNPGTGPFCLFNCPPPVGSVSASPQQVSVPQNGTGATTLRWTWDESRAKPVAEYACLWVSAGDEPNAHMVDCEHPGNQYTVNIPWIATGTYTFWVALGNPKGGPSTVPIANLVRFAQTTVVGISQ
ncbi:hypothetical protein [Burkholderia ubonensis]|uniref:hypothetical protein n=1 Tax=Burkholderia ubonensis TaxID=101571 RepID=UPI000B081A27|nr:hypothetical protein [Burkholderia ubonensis]